MIYIEIIRPGRHGSGDRAWARIDHGFLTRDEAVAWANATLSDGVFFRMRRDGKTIETCYARTTVTT